MESRVANEKRLAVTESRGKIARPNLITMEWSDAQCRAVLFTPEGFILI
jgi:hypothetical protein